MQITDNGRRLSSSDWHNVDVFLLGIDNIAYHFRTGVYAQVQANICAHANAARALAPLRTLWRENGLIEADKVVRPQNLNDVFPLITDFYRQQGNEQLVNYLYNNYTADYSAVPPQPDFVKAVEKLREHDKRVPLYTESPYGTFDGRLMHANKVLAAVGFAPDAFPEKEVVDLLKLDRNPTLAAHVKPEEIPQHYSKANMQGFLNTCVTLGIDANQFQNTAYFAGRASKFSPVGSLGMNHILIGLCEKPLAHESDGKHAHMKVWQDERDESGRYFSTGGCLLSAVAALKHIGPRGRKASTKTAFSKQSNVPAFNPALTLS